MEEVTPTLTRLLRLAGLRTSAKANAELVLAGRFEVSYVFKERKKKEEGFYKELPAHGEPTK